MKYHLALFLIGLAVARLNGQSLTPVATHTNMMSAAYVKDDSTDTIPASESMVNDSLRIEMQQQKKQIALQMAKANLTYFIIRVPDNTYGYTIFIDGQMYIEQKSIPAVSGNAGFVSKDDAEKVAKLVIEKIRQGEMPPTVSTEDLQLLKIGD